MAVIVKYVVERNGVEKMTFAAKNEADAYDKMLDMADDLFVLLGASQLLQDEQMQETLALYLAQHKDEVLQALGAKAKTVKKDKITEQNETQTDVKTDAEAPQDVATAALNLVAA
ncbi:YebG family protein [Rheinheimera sp. 4Y26]|uniref:YebG family protein n=1 Tax=Rheinheimera sp. 4Y26 TaxID=2977811 RepID=UPI0028BECD68|nr:YebG family protein [Rheinheimera sp. 4Y26]